MSSDEQTAGRRDQTEAPVRVGQIVASIVALVEAGQEDERLLWASDRTRVAVLTRKSIAASGRPQTVQDRRRRFRKALAEAMSAAGWRPVTGTRPSTFERRSGDSARVAAVELLPAPDHASRTVTVRAQVEGETRVLGSRRSPSPPFRHAHRRNHGPSPSMRVECGARRVMTATMAWHEAPATPSPFRGQAPKGRKQDR